MFHILMTIIVADAISLIQSAPGHYISKGETNIQGGIPEIFTIKDGNVGVNFLGFKASAGLGGLLTGNIAQGGLHAKAETPFGHSAKTGIQGSLANGNPEGKIYAGAKTGDKVAADVGLQGNIETITSHDSHFIDTSIKDVQKATATSASILPENEIRTENYNSFAGRTNEKKSVLAKAYIDRTFIPKYGEKTMYVPTYVERTIKVPTLTPHKIRVPAPPAVIDKEVHRVPSTINNESSFKGEFSKNGADPFNGELNSYHQSITEPEGSVSGVSVHKSVVANPQLFNDIFNIPISTLGAINRLVSGIAGSGSVSVSKSLTTF